MAQKGTKPTRKRASTMTDEHKQALAAGREEGRAVRKYLEALESHRPKRGRKRTAESVQRRLDAIDAAIGDADALTRLHLAQERLNLQAELVTLSAGAPDLTALEKGFVSAAKSYSKRKGLTYSAWREAGVPADVLRRAGIGRGSGG